MKKKSTSLSHIINVAKSKGVSEVVKRVFYFVYDRVYLTYRTISLYITTGYWLSKTQKKPSHKKALFVDAGSNLGQGWRFFRKFYPPEHFDYELFEPNPNCIPFLEIEMQPIISKCMTHLNEVAVGTQFEKLKFYGIDESEGGKLSDGGTILKEGNSGRINHTDDRSIEVNAIDFTVFIEDKSHVYSKIIIKMDIEGAEYSVLEKMLSTNSFEKIDTIFVEFHSRQMTEPDKSHYRAKEKQLVSAIKKTPCKFVKWI